MEEIVLRGGKYRFWMDGSVLRCARYYENDYWRDFTGDNAVLALFRECLELRQFKESIENQDYHDADEN